MWLGTMFVIKLIVDTPNIICDIQLTVREGNHSLFACKPLRKLDASRGYSNTSISAPSISALPLYMHTIA